LTSGRSWKRARNKKSKRGRGKPSSSIDKRAIEVKGTEVQDEKRRAEGGLYSQNLQIAQPQ
jgi:hypothetical protein